MYIKYVQAYPQAFADELFFKITLPMHFSDSIATKMNKTIN